MGTFAEVAVRKVVIKPRKRRLARMGAPETATCYEANGGKIIFPFAEGYYAKEHNASAIRIVVNGTGEIEVQDKDTGKWMTASQVKAPKGAVCALKGDKK